MQATSRYQTYDLNAYGRHTLDKIGTEIDIGGGANLADQPKSFFLCFCVALNLVSDLKKKHPDGKQNM